VDAAAQCGMSRRFFEPSDFENVAALALYDYEPYDDKHGRRILSTPCYDTCLHARSGTEWIGVATRYLATRGYVPAPDVALYVLRHESGQRALYWLYDRKLGAKRRRRKAVALDDRQ